MPEFNISMNLKRSLFAVWQEYQGLGLVGGMGHATDLIRQVIILPFVLILPSSLIRYLWHFSMLVLGTLGVYFGLKKIFLNHKSYFVYPPIVGALFYLLNFGTIQYFWVPLESFSAFWGFFPWLIFSLWDYLAKPSRLTFTQLVLFNLLAIPSFYVQTIFIVYMLCLFLILLSHFLTNYRLPITHYLKSILIILTLNSFWLLPFFYFLSGNLHNPVAGIGNFMSSEESFMRNQKRGYISDFLLLRGYYYDFPGLSGDLMTPWTTHFSNILYLIPGYLLSVFVIIGLVYSLTQFKKPISLGLSLLFLLSCLALLSATPPFSFINSLIRQSSLLNQVFRAPFTKFIVPTIFTFSILSAFGFQSLITIATKLKYSPRYFSLFLFTGYLVLITTFSFPVFKGNFFYSKMRQQVLPQYFKLFEYLKTQPKTARIANLPQGSFWGWTQYRQGVHGSGFLWYGVEQPILDRAFDAWNLKNEQYYWELNTALIQQDPVILSQIFSKYSVEFVLFDDNVFFPEEKIYSKQALATKNLLPQVPGLKLDHQFGSIQLYRYSHPTKPYLISSPANISVPEFIYTDKAYSDFSDYISNSKASTIFPFSLFTNRLQSELDFHPSIQSNNLIISTPSQNITLPLNDIYNQSSEISPLITPYQQTLGTKSNPFYHLSNLNNHHVIAWNFPSAPLNQAYLIKVNYRHLQGLPLTLSVNSDNLSSKYFNTRLGKSSQWQTAWFTLPPSQSSGSSTGFTIVFDNSSLSYQPTVNDIKSVSIYPINLDSVISSHTPLTSNLSHSRTYLSEKSLIFLHLITLTSGNSTHLVLPQSYDPGWLAFYFQGFKPIFLQNHGLINNWANGWQIPTNLTNYQLPITVYIIFWPQLLEFMGLALTLITFFRFTRRSS
jgi:hypothetical protein